MERETSTGIQRHPRHDNSVTNHEDFDFRKTLVCIHRLDNDGHRSPFLTQEDEEGSM